MEWSCSTSLFNFMAVLCPAATAEEALLNNNNNNNNSACSSSSDQCNRADRARSGESTGAGLILGLEGGGRSLGPLTCCFRLGWVPGGWVPGCSDRWYA